VRRRRRPLHLLEVGIQWPPEPFLSWKLEGLAAAGMLVTVATRQVADPDSKLSRVEMLALPRGREQTGLPVVASKLLRSLVVAPRRTLRLLYEIARVPSDWRHERGGILVLLASYLPLLRLRPDVIHFEWHSSAVHYLPLYRVWRAPVVTSCHGSDVTLFPYVPGQEFWAPRAPEMLERVSAVH